MLRHFPDYNELWVVKELRAKSRVLALGLNLKRLDAYRPSERAAGPPLILWNHRWEYDKDPETFFRAIYALVDEGFDFGLLLLGRSHRNQPTEFLEARQRLPERIVHFGYARDAVTYGRRLWQADIVVSTALHDFFGAAVVEACYCDCFPVLPQDLAYPELIPEQHHESCLYTDFDGLLDRLRWAITNVESARAFSVREHVARFDWDYMAPIYDNLLADLQRML